MPKLIQVAVGVLTECVNGECHILIARRPDHAVLGGLWEFPGGKIEPPETPRQCLVREFQEELDLHVRVARPLPVIEHAYPHALVRLHAFFCTRLAGEPRNLHVAEHRWVTPLQLREQSFPPANAPLVAYIIDNLTAKAPPI